MSSTIMLITITSQRLNSTAKKNANYTAHVPVGLSYKAIFLPLCSTI